MAGGIGTYGYTIDDRQQRRRLWHFDGGSGCRRPGVRSRVLALRASCLRPQHQRRQRRAGRGASNCEQQRHRPLCVELLHVRGRRARAPADSQSMACRRRDTGWSAPRPRPAQPPSSGPPTVSRGAYAARSMVPSSSAGASPWWEGPRARRCRIPTAHIAGCIAWRAPESWFEDFGRGERWSAVKRWSRSICDFELRLSDAAEYHVFLTGHDGRFDLSVSDQTAKRVPGTGERPRRGHLLLAGWWRSGRILLGVRFAPVEIPKEPVLLDVAGLRPCRHADAIRSSAGLGGHGAGRGEGRSR